MKRILLLLSVSAVMVLVFASAALATHHTAMSTATATASPTADATASMTATATSSATSTASPLPKSGGPPLVLPFTLVASLALVGSGVAALKLLRRSIS